MIKSGVITIFSRFLSLEPERQNAILNAALKEFAAKGFDDASTNVIAKESGISKPLMFHYVNNKKDYWPWPGGSKKAVF